MGKNSPKMLIPVLGKPLIYWTLKNLERCSSVQSLVVVVPPDQRELFWKKIRAWHFRKVSAVTDGGKERADSARNALRFVPYDCRWVGIHDGARPFVSPDLVRRCFESARKTGAAILAVPSKETIKIVRKNSLIEKTVPRSQCWSAQTPQVFRRDIAEKIHQFNGKPIKKFDSAFVTDDAFLAESFGFRVRIVPGSYENIKITTPEDLILAESILKKGGHRLWRT